MAAAPRTPSRKPIDTIRSTLRQPERQAVCHIPVLARFRSRFGPKTGYFSTHR